MKYRLKKDLPWMKAGKIFQVYDSRSEKVIELLADGEVFTYPRDTFLNWFEEVDKRWKPEDKEKYLYLNTALSPVGAAWLNDSSDETWHSIGNCFRTRELAERAAEQIKTLLKEFHKNNP